MISCCYLADQSHSAQGWLEWTLSGSFVLMTTYNVLLVIHPFHFPSHIPAVCSVSYPVFFSSVYLRFVYDMFTDTTPLFFQQRTNNFPAQSETNSFLHPNTNSCTRPSTHIPSRLGSEQLHAFHTFIFFTSPACAFIVLWGRE
jgi:hypothetical protein